MKTSLLFSLLLMSLIPLNIIAHISIEGSSRHYGAQLGYIQDVGPQGQFLETEEAKEGSHSH